MWGRIGLVISFWLFAIYATAQTSKYTAEQIERFKQGSFIYKNGEFKGGKIKRTKKWQYEQYSGLLIKFRIDWVSNYEYHLTFKQVSDPTGGCLVGKVIKVKLLEYAEENDMYTVVVQNGSSFKIVEIERIETEKKKEGRIFSFMK
jgi:hypothetical protein